jgi:[acyl-carrier-protein] S-malonyltransferase
MGRDFFEASAKAQDVFTAAEEISGLPLKKLCFEGPLEELTLTLNLQPAVVAVDLLCWQALDQAGVKPAAVAGHSLGEYPALVACGAITIEDCLKLVSLRGRLMDRDAQARPGAMSAIMGLSPEEVSSLTSKIEGVVQPANFNTPVQTVITGEKEAVSAAAKLAQDQGAKAIPLKVSGAWHSPLMAEAGREMSEAVAAVDIKAPSCLHVPNPTGIPTRDPGEIKSELARQLTSPVRWVQAVQALLDQGVDTFIEAGPKKVLAGLIKKTADGRATVYNVEDSNSLNQTLEALG